MPYGTRVLPVRSICWGNWSCALKNQHGPGELIGNFVMMADVLHSYTTNAPFVKGRVYILKGWQ